MAEKSVSTESLGTEKKQEYSGKKLRMAYIGCGGIAQTHLKALQTFPDVEIVAAVDIDPERLAIERKYLEDDGPGALAAFRERRAASLTFLEALDPNRLTRALPRPSGGPLSGLDLLAAWVTHDRLHTAQLAATLARTWATRWAPLRTEYAWSIPYPPS